jgi:hypothetical protein
VPDQNFIDIFWQSQTFCARQKNDLHSVKLVFVPAQKFLEGTCPFTGSKMFWAGPNFLCQTKKLFTYCGSHKHFVPDREIIAFCKIAFCASTKVFVEALNAVKFLAWLYLDQHKTFWDL